MLRSLPTLDFHEKQRARRFFSSPITFAVLAVLILIASYNAWDMYQKSRHTAAALEKSGEAYGELAERKEFLSGKLSELSTVAGIESEIRERFGVAKAGEEVIVVLSDEEKEELPPPPQGFWMRLRAWLSGTNDNYVKNE